MSTPMSPMTTSQRRTRQIGRDLFDRIGRGPSPWERAWWDDRLMDLTLGDPRGQGPALPVHRRPARAARPTEVGPAATWPSTWTRPGDRVPWWLRLAVGAGPERARSGDRLLARGSRAAATHMARRFIAGETPDEALATVRGLRRQRLAFTADLLGEAVISEPEADAYQQTCLDLLRGLAGPLAAEPEIPQIDRDDRGPDPAGQPLAQADQPDRPVRRPPRRGDRRPRRASGSGRSSGRPASSGRTSTSTWSSTPTRT